MVDHENLMRLIDAFNDAALEPGHWQTALGHLGEAIGDSGVVVISAYDPPTGAHLLESFGYDLDYWKRVQTEHSSPETNQYIKMINAAQPGQVLQPRTAMSIAEWLDDGIYRKFLRPDGLTDGLACPLFHKTGGFAAVATFRSSHYGPEHIELLQAAAPHLGHALRVHLRLHAQDRTIGAGEAALDSLRSGIVLSDAVGRIIFANRAAREILDESDGISVARGGYLLAGNPKNTNRLLALIRCAAVSAGRSSRQASKETNQAPAASPIRLARPSGASPLELLVAPLRIGMLAGISSVQGPAAMILFSHSDSAIQVELAALREMYGLTAAEARLAVQLLLGKSVPAAAGAMGVSVNTAKTLLRRSFERTGTSRQTDFVAQITRGPLGSVRWD